MKEGCKVDFFRKQIIVFASFWQILVCVPFLTPGTSLRNISTMTTEDQFQTISRLKQNTVA